MDTYTLPYVKEIASGLCLITQDTTWDNLRGGIRWEVEGRSRREGTYVYIPMAGSW